MVKEEREELVQREATRAGDTGGGEGSASAEATEEVGGPPPGDSLSRV